jgi:hypothetical protein
MAYELGVALRASCALVSRMMLADGVHPGVENSFAALGAAEVRLECHKKEERTSAARSRTLAMRREDYRKLGLMQTSRGGDENAAPRPMRARHLGRGRVWSQIAKQGSRIAV